LDNNIVKPLPDSSIQKTKRYVSGEYVRYTKPLHGTDSVDNHVGLLNIVQRL